MQGQFSPGGMKPRAASKQKNSIYFKSPSQQWFAPTLPPPPPTTNCEGGLIESQDLFSPPGFVSNMLGRGGWFFDEYSSSVCECARDEGGAPKPHNYAIQGKDQGRNI